ncbi:hypothetical protein J8F10_23425 [Gemmata sp. G18]|uniref:Uncharacterized protein n=1 Tax=Gemmata palustris TaxID=2822762 RepID=A0ABS5BWU9_9BACT|nr:hypothetical protein [Gemmata palustris]MBP3958210.1 hypothetical protein [Gemmata palustris]
MRLQRLAHRSSAIIFGVLTTAFVVWVWEGSSDGQPQIVGPRPPALGVAGATLTTDEDTVAPVGHEAKPAPQGTTQMLFKLKPGMLRTEVEWLVGVPAPQCVHPATITAGRVTYHTSYEADLTPLSTVRPPAGHVPFTQEQTRVRLEFDATKIGHPLLDIYYPDPLF